MATDDPRAANPTGFLEDESTEFVRIFRKPDGGLFFMVQRPDDEDQDPAFWAIVAVDLLHHAASSEERRGLATEDGPCTVDHILERIREIFDAEWKDRTDQVEPILDG